MKTKRLRIILAILITAIVGGVGWQVLRPREPVYKGETFNMWLDEYIASYGHLTEAEVAIRHIGTNALPQLLRMVAARDSHVKQIAIKLARKQTLISIGRPEAEWQHERANWAFNVLGPDAKFAVPGLVALLDDKDREVRERALGNLSSIRHSASNAVPAIIKQVNDKDGKIRESAISVLVIIHSMPELVVPTLTASLNDPVPRVRLSALRGLGAFGVNAKPAIPALIELLNKAQKSDARSEIEDALKYIDREAAAKAGVK
jgi:HEAT repeat protein